MAVNFAHQDDDVSAHLFSPYQHVASLSSKNVRSRFVDAFNAWLNLPEAAAEGVKRIVDKLHNASLLVDDIEDSSVMRRGAPTAHQLFGMPLTLNCANHVYFVALSDVLGLVRSVAASLLNPANDKSEMAAALRQHYEKNEMRLTLQLTTIFTNELVELHEGQGLDILWRDTFTCPTLEQYDAMVLKKTGGLFRLALRMMLALAPPETAGAEQQGSPSSRTEEQLLDLVNHIGIFFQTLDDLLNVTSDDYHQNKSFCDDLTEGKFSYPVIHCILESRARDDHRLFHIIRQRPRDNEVKAFAVKLMQDSGSIRACKARVEQLRDMIVTEIDVLGGSTGLLSCVNSLANKMEH